MYCSKCNSEIPEDAMFCTNCGEKIEQKKIICTCCGRELADGATFCVNCGTKIGIVNTMKKIEANENNSGFIVVGNEVKNEQNKNIESSKKHSGCLVCLGCCGVILIVAIVCFLVLCFIIGLCSDDNSNDVSIDNKTTQVQIKTKNKEIVEENSVDEEPYTTEEMENEGFEDPTTEDLNVDDLADGEYLIPYSAERELIKTDYQNLSKKELCYAKNEIYARHGYSFVSPELREYFMSKSWYKEDKEYNSSNMASRLSAIEQANANKLAQAEKSAGDYDGLYRLDE